MKAEKTLQLFGLVSEREMEISNEDSTEPELSKR
jgi:hypothetical protein